MGRRLTSATRLDTLKKEAKRWLKALRAGDAGARARFDHAYPGGPAAPGLRDVQHALAREHGLAGWTALAEALADGAAAERGHAERVLRFLEYACPDHHVRGGPAHVMARHAAERILARHPEIARASLATAVVCGELAEVERRLAERPAAAAEAGPARGPARAGAGDSNDLFKNLGPKGWSPLLYLCFTRLDRPAVNEYAVATALLDRGADPNAFFMAGASRYTPLVGVVGEGEEERPPHPRRDELVRLLLERGAEPYDLQVLYNVHFRGDVLWYLRLIHAETARRGRQADWEDPEWSMLSMGSYGCGARYLLGIAVKKNDLELADWCLRHGASPNAPPAPGSERWRPPRTTLREEALRGGCAAMADLLACYGAAAGAAVLEGDAAFGSACLRLDREGAKALLAGHPEYLRSPGALFAAAEQDRADVVEFVLDLGMSPDLVDAGGQRALHVAAYHDAVRAAALLIERGAAIDPKDATHGATPLWWAVWGQRRGTIELLSRFSRNVSALAVTGNVARLREVLAGEPELARERGEHETPLMWLPDDEARAMEIAELLLAHGADPSVRNQEGQTAADLARLRGLEEVAALLEDGAETAGDGVGVAGGRRRG